MYPRHNNYWAQEPGYIIFEYDCGVLGLIWLEFVDKCGFTSEETGGFLLPQNKYSKSLSWAENLNFLPKTVNDLFKFSAQDSDL